ncbi:hypothetical protein PYCCODRAFT_1447858 [Trametes coccinea BRFM310]|uniref:WD40 repeat-like protein n=1 Tax=Trametes coccinea (strain BRFM310) TaxID=1353009 RepID=A0A1Y2ICW5_TRAC3|nr:hypothetical protein PYCCODRAFT_1447858 [Trametes coccinea BRFM310]
MPRTSSYLKQLDALSRQIASFNDADARDSFKNLLIRVADVVRQAENAEVSDLAEIVAKAEQVFDAAIGWAYTDGDYDFLPSYAHKASDSPLLQDPFQRFGYGTASSFLQLIGRFGQGPVPQAAIDELLPTPWTESRPRHTKSTRLSRFRDGVRPSVTDATPRAQMIYDARCEVAADSFPSPIQAAISADSSVLTIIGQGGWKNREPVLGMYLLDAPPLDNEGGGGGFRCMVLNPGLEEVASQLALDTTRKLSLVADSERIKSFSWGGDIAFRGWTPPRGANVHTMQCRGYNGPIAVLPDGSVVRAGKGGAALWNLDALETHERGRVGRRLRLDGLFTRDNDNNEIERSTGSAPTTTLAFAEKDFRPAVWYRHAPTGHLLCAEDARETSHYGCFAIDLEQNGKKVTRFLGHGGNVHCFSTSDGDAHTFATASSDGFARLFDVRRPLPVMTLDAGQSSEFCMAVQLIHPDGVPTVFTGGQRSECIKTWDIRARAIVYELATGNNGVEALAWDGVRNTLYAATECSGMDRLGYTHDYRPAKIPRWADLCPDASHNPHGMAVDEEDDAAGDDEYDSMEEDDYERYWPKDAHHSEKHFGYAYDAGEHVLLRYQFKEDPDTTLLPEYGQARPTGNDW